MKLRINKNIYKYPQSDLCFIFKPLSFDNGISPNSEYLTIYLSSNSIYLDDILAIIRSNLTGEEISDLIGDVERFNKNKLEKKLLHGYYSKVIEL